MNTTDKLARRLRQFAFVALATLPASALADSGFYVGGSFGSAAIDADFSDIPGIPSDFDEDDSAWKAFLGYRLDLPAVFLEVEGGYVDLGAPEFSVGTETLQLDTTGMNLWGIAGLEAGPMELFVKAGYVAWDSDIFYDDGAGTMLEGKDDGSDLGYGLGIAFGLGPVQVRGEYEKYDVEDADVSMVSVGFSYLFD